MNWSNEETVRAEAALSKTKLDSKIPFDLSIKLLMESSENLDQFKSVVLKFEDSLNKKKRSLSIFSTLFPVNINPGIKFYLNKYLESLKEQASSQN